MAKEFTSFDVSAVVRELKSIIATARVSNVYQLDRNTILLKLHKPDEAALRLLIESGGRVHLTSYEPEKPQTPPAFCMALRKYLREAIMVGVEQHEFERMLAFDFRNKARKVRLVAEIFGDGNLILVDESGVIMQALHFRRMRDRAIIRGGQFKYPPLMGKYPFLVTEEELRIRLHESGNAEIVRTLARFLGIGGLYSEEVLLRARIDKTRPSDSLTGEEQKAIFSTLQSLLFQLSKGSLEPCVIQDKNGIYEDAVPLMLRRYEADRFVCKRFESFNAALDEFYARTLTKERLIAERHVEESKREAERLSRVIDEQQSVQASSEKEAEEYRRVGDAIYAHSGELQSFIDRIVTEKRSGKTANRIVTEITSEKVRGEKPSAFFESLDDHRQILRVYAQGISFDLDLRRSVFDNAAGYYDRSKRAKQRLVGAKAALAESQRKLAGLEANLKGEEEILPEVEHVLLGQRVKRKEWFEKFRWFRTSDDFLVVAGKDAVSNEVLVKKHADDLDIVFHADIVGAPFVVVKTEGKSPSDQSLHEAAEFAAAFSRGWREGFGSIDVYWVKPAQLSKGGPSGESVPRGGFVVSGQRNWMRSVPLKLAIGVALRNSEVRFWGGPVVSVKSRASVYVEIVPGDSAGREFLRKITQALAGRLSADARENVLKTSIETIREFVPYSCGRILDEVD